MPRVDPSADRPAEKAKESPSPMTAVAVAARERATAEEAARTMLLLLRDASVAFMVRCFFVDYRRK